MTDKEFLLTYRIINGSSMGVFNVVYSLKNQRTGQVIAEEEPYRYSTSKDKFDSPKAINNYIMAALRMWCKAKHGIGESITRICLNDDYSWAPKELLADKPTEVPVKVETPVKPVDNSRLFEVVQIHGVWTIVKHDKPLLTEQQAKIEFFAKVVNG